MSEKMFANSRLLKRRKLYFYNHLAEVPFDTEAELDEFLKALDYDPGRIEKRIHSVVKYAYLLKKYMEFNELLKKEEEHDVEAYKKRQSVVEMIRLLKIRLSAFLPSDYEDAADQSQTKVNALN